MKIVHVYKDFYPPVAGGMERHIALMCRYQQRWAEVEALVCSRSRVTRVVDRDGTRVTEVGEWGRFQSAPVSPAFPWHMRHADADVMVVHVPNPTAELGWLMARPRGRLVVRYHSDVVRQAGAMRVYRPLQLAFLRRAAAIIPTSEQYMQTSATLCAVAQLCKVIPLGIIPEEFADPDPQRVARLKRDYGESFVLFAGRHRYYKGLPYLVRAAATIQARVVFAGDGPERPGAMALARDLGINAIFPGELSHEDLVAHLHACTVFAFPSVERSEAFGMSILEAHVCGKPVVATRLGTGVEYANLDGYTGLNVPPRDSDALAEAVNSLLSDPRRCTELGDNARRRVCKEFRAETVARAEFELYQDVSGCSITSC